MTTTTIKAKDVRKGDMVVSEVLRVKNVGGSLFVDLQRSNWVHPHETLTILKRKGRK